MLLTFDMCIDACRMWDHKEYAEDPDVVAKRRAGKAAAAADEAKSTAKTARKSAPADAGKGDARPPRLKVSLGSAKSADGKSADAKAGRDVDRPSSRAAAEPAQRPDSSGSSISNS